MYKVKSITTISWLIVTASLLGACAGKPTTYTTRPAVNPASTVQIKANLDIPDQRARVFMQNGTVLAEKAINRWDAYCSVLVRDVQYSDQPQQTVQPGHFDILKVRESNDYTTASKIYVASNSIFWSCRVLCCIGLICTWFLPSNRMCCLSVVRNVVIMVFVLIILRCLKCGLRWVI